MNTTSPLLELKEITKEFPTPATLLVVLKQVNFQLQQNEIVGIVGPSGSGKSTFLNLVGTLDSPTSGQIVFESQDVSQYNEKQLAQFRNQNIGFVFQEHHLLPQCSVLENVLLPTVPANAPSDESVSRAKELIERVGLSGRMHHKPGQLSGGERQRVAYIRSLINEPKLVLADEPTGALDQKNAENLMNILVEINKSRGLACIIVTHALELVKHLDRVFKIDDGVLVETAPAS